MDDEWQFWREQLAGGTPETTPGTPHAGYFIAKEYVSIPGGAKRVLTDFPVAIWKDPDGNWIARGDKLLRGFNITMLDEIDELFGKVCRNPITHERYQEMVKALVEFAA